MAKNASPTQTDSTTKAATNNRSQQLNDQDPKFHQSRGHSEGESQTRAAETTQSNQEKKGR